MCTGVVLLYNSMHVHVQQTAAEIAKMFYCGSCFEGITLCT